MRRRIWFLVNGDPFGGAETQVARLAGWLSSRGDDVEVHTLLPNSEFKRELARRGIEMRTARMSIPRGVTAIASLTRTLRRQPPDVVISFLYQSVVAGRLAGALARVPVIVSSLRNEFIGPRRRETVLRATDRLSAATVVNSEEVAGAHLGRGLLKPGRFEVIPNAVEVNEFDYSQDERGKTREDLGFGPTAFVWLAAGRLWPQKDFGTLIAAFAKSSATFPDSVLMIAGEGPERESLMAEAAKLSVAERVRFLGYRGDIPRLMGAADALALSSAWEGVPNVVLEALASRLPVVATGVGGVAEILPAEMRPYLSPPGDPDSLADAMTRLMALDRSERRRLADRGREVVESRFGLDEVGGMWVRLIERLSGDLQPVPDPDSGSTGARKTL
jgi:glycosyltransferase involved in cell wall biosynthesis